MGWELPSDDLVIDTKPPTNGQVLTASSATRAGWATAGGGSGFLGTIILQDQKAAGTDGGGVTGTGSLASTSYTTHVLNTEVIDTNGDCTLASNQFTLAAGTYEAEAFVMFYQVEYYKIRIRNVTDGVTVLVGSPGYATAAAGATNTSQIIGRFTVAASKALELQYIAYATKSSNGLGVSANFGEIEIYANLLLHRVT